MRNLRVLVLRENAITEALSLATLPALEELELYGNKLRDLAMLGPHPRLRKLDVSFNSLRRVAPLQLPALEELYLVHNKLAAVEGLEALTALTTLELGDNRLRALAGLDTLTRLRKLYCGTNKLTRIEGLQQCGAQLEILSFQCNRLTSLEGLERCCPLLRELYVSENGLEALDAAAVRLCCPQLAVLDAGHNRLAGTLALDGLTHLEDLWLNHNAIVELRLAQLPALTTLYLEGNPAAAAPGYEAAMRAMVPTLTQLDALALKRLP